jgi:hypothetical protein
MAGALRVGKVMIERDVPVRMRDQTVLRCNIYRPEDAGKVPVLVQRQPYNKDMAQAYVYANPAWYARRGYAVLVQDSRGRYASDGTFYPLRHDGEDGYDTIEWAAAQPWSNGKVGSFGFSIPGINQLLAAALKPPHLVAAIPGFYPAGMYHGFTHVGGAFGLAAVMDWGLLLASDAAKRAGDRAMMDRIRAAAGLKGAFSPTLALREIPFLVEPPLLPFLRDYLEHPCHDSYWQEWELGPRIPDVAVPCLHVGGWYDSFITQTITSYESFAKLKRAEHRLVVGPWYHIPWTQQVGAIDFGDDARNMVDELQLAWFDAHLKGKRAALDALPPVRLFVTGENHWRDYDGWPCQFTQRQRHAEQDEAGRGTAGRLSL